MNPLRRSDWLQIISIYQDDTVNGGGYDKIFFTLTVVKSIFFLQYQFLYLLKLKYIVLFYQVFGQSIIIFFKYTINNQTNRFLIIIYIKSLNHNCDRYFPKLRMNDFSNSLLLCFFLFKK